MKDDVYQTIADRFIAQLKRGRCLGRNLGLLFKNIILRKPYRGINALLLGSTDYQSPFWVSFKQAVRRVSRMKGVVNMT